MATGSVQQFCLRWNNHQPNFISVFSNLLNSESLVDVTLAAEGKHLQAHKIVLSACSSYFQSLFTVNPCKHPIVILKDIKYTDLKIMVDFMYCGEVNVSQEQLPAVLKTAETLKVKGLAEMPEHNISLTSATGDKNTESSPAASPSMLRRKRLRKSSTGSGSGSTEQTTTGGSEETAGSGVPSPSNQVKIEPTSENEGSLRHEPSTESEPGFASQESVEDEPTPSLQQQSSEERSESGLKSSTSMEDSNTPSTSSQLHFSSGWGNGSAASSSQQDEARPAKRRDQDDDNCCIVITPCTKTQIACTSTSTSTDPMSPPKTSPTQCCQHSHPLPSPTSSRGRGRRVKDAQHSENFHNALEAVRVGGLGFCKAARLFGVNNRTLWLEYKRLGYPVTRRSLKTAKADSDSDNKPSSSRLDLSQPSWSPAPAASSNIFDASFFFQNQFENYLPVIKSSPASTSHQQHEYHQAHQPSPLRSYSNTGTIMLATNNGSNNVNISSTSHSSSPVSSTHSVSPLTTQVHSHPPPPLPHPPPNMPTSSNSHSSSHSNIMHNRFNQ